MPDSERSIFLIFGSTGSIGNRCSELLEENSIVIRGEKTINGLNAQLSKIEAISGVIWAQGRNATDSIIQESNELELVLQANLFFIVESLMALISTGKLKRGAQLVIIGSVWSSLARPDKMSYIVSKSAIGGLVRSLAVDLGKYEIQVNAISPGPVDTRMTRNNLTIEEIKRIEKETPLGRLIELDEICRIIVDVARGRMKGMTGQEITVDGGWGISKLEKD